RWHHAACAWRVERARQAAEGQHRAARRALGFDFDDAGGRRAWAGGGHRGRRIWGLGYAGVDRGAGDDAVTARAWLVVASAENDGSNLEASRTRLSASRHSTEYIVEWLHNEPQTAVASGTPAGDARPPHPPHTAGRTLTRPRHRQTHSADLGRP